MVQNLEHLMDDYDERLVKLRVFKNYHDLTRRLKKTCYYGKHYTNTPSLPFSLIVVEFFNQAAANEDLKKLDLNYVTSVSKGSYITPCSIVLGMMYVEQLLHNNPDYLHKISPNELFLVSMMVASKFINESEEVYLGDFAVAGKQTVRDLTSLEMEFLRHLDWKLNAPPATVADWLNEIEYRIVRRESSWRGWHTYTDLLVMVERLAAQQDWTDLLAHLLSVLALITAVYLSLLLTLLALTTPLPAAPANCSLPVPLHSQPLLLPPASNASVLLHLNLLKNYFL